MTPEVKARTLSHLIMHDVFEGGGKKEIDEAFQKAKKISIICCDEVIDSYKQSKKDYDLYAQPAALVMNANDSIRYWKSVRTEIEKL